MTSLKEETQDLIDYLHRQLERLDDDVLLSEKEEKILDRLVWELMSFLQLKGLEKKDIIPQNVTFTPQDDMNLLDSFKSHPWDLKLTKF